MPYAPFLVSALPLDWFHEMFNLIKHSENTYIKQTICNLPKSELIKLLSPILQPAVSSLVVITSSSCFSPLQIREENKSSPRKTFHKLHYN